MIYCQKKKFIAYIFETDGSYVVEGLTVRSRSPSSKIISQQIQPEANL
ncbi:MAG: hypothetical protein Satyrvirus7_35 [Satyrvirus sp.]|uniref:Uncharacterized protein n=1 Tax=Satyrvirus sp. TaxID=2487771 RepID=A0A3G5AG35_9VIRU|nr:MAG: hypothetical protein Satyrvirus7_35 [Satyrvirus sp.]